MKSRYCLLWLLSLGVASSALAEKDRLEISGRILLDGDYYENFWNKEGKDSNYDARLRNARLQFDYDFPRGWEGKLQIDASGDADDNDVDLGSTYLRYLKWEPADVTLGRLKEPIGLERTTTASNLLTIEAAMMTSAFTPGKSWGLHLLHARKTHRWQLAAVVEDDQDDDYEKDPPRAVSGRYSWSPLHSGEQILYLGASASYRDWNKNTFQLRERAEVGTADNVVRSAEFTADKQVLLGLEGAWRLRNWQLQGEFMATRVEELAGPDWEYSGYYLSGSYFLTGEQRPFAKGRFKAVKPIAASGAWELVARYSYLDTRQRGLGAQAAVTTLGVNYYYSKNIKLMLAALHPDIAGSVTHPDPDGNALSLRLQFLF